MSTNKILLKFAKKGINLSPEAYDKVVNAENPLDFASSLIVKLKSDKFTSKDLVCVSGETIDEITGVKTAPESGNQDTLIKPEEKETKKTVDKTPQPPKKLSDTKKEPPKKAIKKKSEPAGEKKEVKKADSIDDLKKESDEPNYVNKIIKEASETIKDTNIKFKRNEQKTNVEYDFKIIQDTSKKSYTSGELENLISYFKSRYEKLANILSRRPELRNYTKIADIDDGMDSLSLILMVREIRSSKNGHKIVEFEDDTGNISILFSNKNEELFAEAEKLVRDEVVGVIANKSSDAGFAFGQQIINPGVLSIPEKKMDFGIVFLSDVHIGSLTFLEDAFQRFIDWINCEAGDEEQRRVAEDVKYLIIGGRAGNEAEDHRQADSLRSVFLNRRLFLPSVQLLVFLPLLVKSNVDGGANFITFFASVMASLIIALLFPISLSIVLLRLVLGCSGIRDSSKPSGLGIATEILVFSAVSFRPDDEISDTDSV